MKLISFLFLVPSLTYAGDNYPINCLRTVSGAVKPLKCNTFNKTWLKDVGKGKERAVPNACVYKDGQWIRTKLIGTKKDGTFKWKYSKSVVCDAGVEVAAMVDPLLTAPRISQSLNDSSCVKEVKNAITFKENGVTKKKSKFVSENCNLAIPTDNKAFNCYFESRNGKLVGVQRQCSEDPSSKNFCWVRNFPVNKATRDYPYEGKWWVMGRYGAAKKALTVCTGGVKHDSVKDYAVDTGKPQYKIIVKKVGATQFNTYLSQIYNASGDFIGAPADNSGFPDVQGSPALAGYTVGGISACWVDNVRKKCRNFGSRSFANHALDALDIEGTAIVDGEKDYTPASDDPEDSEDKVTCYVRKTFPAAWTSYEYMIGSKTYHFRPSLTNPLDMEYWRYTKSNGTNVNVTPKVRAFASGYSPFTRANDPHAGFVVRGPTNTGAPVRFEACTDVEYTAYKRYDP